MKTIIVAMDVYSGIGKENKMPWHLPEDLKHFKETTMGHVVVMGRKTFTSIGRPLPGRLNVVLSRDPNFAPRGVWLANNLKEAFDQAKSYAPDKEVFIIGGGTIYEQAMTHVDRLIVTMLPDVHHCDTWFPAIDLNVWKLREKIQKKEGHCIAIFERSIMGSKN